jgi:hypothetical protein
MSYSHIIRINLPPVLTEDEAMSVSISPIDRLPPSRVNSGSTEAATGVAGRIYRVWERRRKATCPVNG